MVEVRMYVVIMAGGSGTRLWPLSRREQPKQLQRLMSARSLLQETFDRLRAVATPEEVFISTTRELAAACQAQLPEIPVANVLIEPVGRNTGPAVAYAAATFAHRDPDAVVAVVSSDHVIGRADRYAAALELAAQTVAQQPEQLFTIGLQPTWGNPGFGYLEVGTRVDGERLAAVKVERFVEKPTATVAAEYVASGRYLWNAGYFVFRAGTMMAAVARYDAALHHGLRQILAAGGTAAAEAVLDREYGAFASRPIDQLVFEPESLAGHVQTIPAALDWDDLGSWKTLLAVRGARSDTANVTEGEVHAVDTQRCLILANGGRMVATIGLEDVVIVDTPDALLVCRADRSEDVKTVLARLAADDPRR